MTPRVASILVGVVMFLGTVATGPALADWPPTGSPIAPSHFYPEFPFSLAADGAGGAFVSWLDNKLRTSHLTRDGDLGPGWPAQGISYGGNSYFHLNTLSDGAGGMYEVFNAKDCVAHCGPDPSERRVLRLEADGTLSEGWPESGIPVGGGYGPIGFGAGDAGKTASVVDGRGGLLVAWGRYVGDHRGDPVELRVQRMDGEGQRLWGEAGTLIREASGTFPLSVVAGDERGGAFVFWLDARPVHLYAQRVTPGGSPQWAPNGIPIGTQDIAAFSRPVALGDGARGATVAWFGTCGPDTGIFLARVNAGGAFPWGRPMRILEASARIDGLRLVPAENGSTFIVWRDARTPGNESMHVQRIGLGGRLEFGPAGRTICAAPGHRDYLAACPDDRGGLYVAWGDTRPEGEIYATHLDPQGDPVAGWEDGGTPVCPPVAAVWAVDVVSDGAGNAVVAWSDERVISAGGFPFQQTQLTRLRSDGPVTRVVSSSAPAGRRRAAPSVADPSRSDRLAVRAMFPGSGPGGSRVTISLPDAEPASLELFDVGGRRLWSRDIGPLGAGEHIIALADGAWLPPGMYLARLVRAGRIATARVAIVR